MTDRFSHLSNSEAVAYKNGYTCGQQSRRDTALAFLCIGISVGLGIAKVVGL